MSLSFLQTMIHEEMEKEEEYQQKLESAMMNRRQRKPLKSQEPSNATPTSPERFRPNPEGESAQQSRMQHSEPSINNRGMDLDDGKLNHTQPDYYFQSTPAAE